LKAEAQKAIQDGELGKAKEILAKVEKIQDEALDRLALNAAQTAAQLGDVALTQLRYREAAGHFSRAAAKVPQGHEDERWKYLNDEALANQLFTAERDALWPKRLAPVTRNSSKSCGIYSLTKPAYLTARRTATMISAPLLSLSIVTSRRAPDLGKSHLATFQIRLK
jgi:hypothetical protein